MQLTKRRHGGFPVSGNHDKRDIVSWRSNEAQTFSLHHLVMVDASRMAVVGKSKRSVVRSRKNIFSDCCEVLADKVRRRPHCIRVEDIQRVPKERALSTLLHEFSLVLRNRESFVHFSPNI
jgi:hypothetical protein